MNWISKNKYSRDPLFLGFFNIGILVFDLEITNTPNLKHVHAFMHYIIKHASMNKLIRTNRHVRDNSFLSVLFTANSFLALNVKLL